MWREPRISFACRISVEHAYQAIIELLYAGDAKGQEYGLESSKTVYLCFLDFRSRDHVLVLVSRHVEVCGCSGAKYARCRCSVVCSTWIMCF